MKESAMGAFLTKVNESKLHLDAISAYVNEHMGKDPDRLDWADAGDAGRIASMLEEIRKSFPMGR